MGRLYLKGYKNNRTRNQMERSGRGQKQMARFVLNDMVLMAETKKKKKKKITIIRKHFYIFINIRDLFYIQNLRVKYFSIAQ